MIWAHLHCHRMQKGIVFSQALAINVSWPAPCGSSEKVAETGFIPSWLLEQEIIYLQKKNPPLLLQVLCSYTWLLQAIYCHGEMRKDNASTGSDTFTFASSDGSFPCFPSYCRLLLGVAVAWKQKAKQSQCSLWMYNK